MSKPSGRSTPMSKSCEGAKRAPDGPKWIPGVARNRSRGHWRSPRPSGSSRTTRLHTPCNEFGSDANGGSHSVRIFPIGSRLRTLPARSRGLKAFGGIPTSGPCRGDRSKNRTLEFGRVVLELFRWNIASWAANGARFHRSLCDAGRLTTRPRVPSMGSVPSAPAGTTRHRERDHEQAEGQPRAHDGGKPLGRQGGQRRRWGGGLRRPGSARPDFRSPAAPRRPPADALHPVDADTDSHCDSSQLSTTFSAPNSRSMSRAQGTPLVAALIEKPHAVWNSSSTRPCGPNSVSIA